MYESCRRFLVGAVACVACLPTIADAHVLPTDLDPVIGANYEPLDADERGMWQSCERIEELIRTGPQRLRSPELESYTRHVLERLMGRELPEIRIYLMRDAGFNAAMYLSGFMVVNTGFMARARNEAQFAAVLGHESGHYFRKHSIARYRYVRRTTSAMAFIGATANVAAGATSLSGNSGAQSWIDTARSINQALYMSTFQYSRANEAEADAFSVMLMARAGYVPEAASEVWAQLIEEQKASASMRGKRYKEVNSATSSHPPDLVRMQDLADTAALLSRRDDLKATDGRAEWLAATHPYQALFLEEQIKLNDAGASLYLINSQAQDGWTGLLRYNEGEVYRLRNAAGDDSKAAEAYSAATTFPDAPAEAWRAHGYALLKAGKNAEGREALTRYLTMKPDAKDAGIVHFTLTQ
jgi:predicted Zn-dependent protease